MKAIDNVWLISKQQWSMQVSICTIDQTTKSLDIKDVYQPMHFLFLGFGKFHYWLLLVCGWANGSDAVEIICISFLLPSAECDLKLTTTDKGWLSAILFVGNSICFLPGTICLTDFI